MGNGDIPAYVATKHGVVGLSKSVCAHIAAQPSRDYFQLMLNMYRMDLNMASKAFELMLFVRGKFHYSFIAFTRKQRWILAGAYQ